MPGAIVFSHANGLPAGTYRQLFETWRDAGWRVAAIEKFGHDPVFPVTGNWPRLREQLLQFIAAQGGPVHLVGHSLGGMFRRLTPGRVSQRRRWQWASAEGRQVGLAATRALVHGRIEWIEGSHLFPMEKPDETAAAVLRQLLAMQAAPPQAPREG